MRREKKRPWDDWKPKKDDDKDGKDDEDKKDGKGDKDREHGKDHRKPRCKTKLTLRKGHGFRPGEPSRLSTVAVVRQAC